MKTKRARKALRTWWATAWSRPFTGVGTTRFKSPEAAYAKLKKGGWEKRCFVVKVTEVPKRKRKAK